MPVIHCFSGLLHLGFALGDAFVMPNFRDPKIAMLSLLVVFLSALMWVKPQPSSAIEIQQLEPLKLAETSPKLIDPLWRAPFRSELDVLRPFLRPSSDWGAGHRGVDILAGEQTEVLAPHKATIGFANLAFGIPTVVLEHSDGSSQVFQPVCLLATSETGQNLKAGEAFGVFCASNTQQGHCGQIGCIHWSYRLDKGTYVNPLRMIGLLQPSTLLPIGQIETASAV